MRQRQAQKRPIAKRVAQTTFQFCVLVHLACSSGGWFDPKLSCPGPASAGLGWFRRNWRRFGGRNFRLRLRAGLRVGSNRRRSAIGDGFEPVFQQVRHVALHFFKLIELQPRIHDGKYIAGLGMFVNEHALSVPDKFFLYLEQPLALQHYRQDVSGRHVARIVQFDKLAQERLGRIFLNGLRNRGGLFVNPLPVGNETFTLARTFREILGPASCADVHAAQLVPFFQQERMIMLLVGEMLAAGFATMPPGLDVPFVHWCSRQRRWYVLFPSGSLLQLQLHAEFTLFREHLFIHNLYGMNALALVFCLTTLLCLPLTAFPGTVTVFAAASLTDALRLLGTRFETATGDQIVFNFAASSVLERQIEAGAPADIFFSADELKMSALAGRGLIVPETRRDRLSNTLVVIVPIDSSLALHSAKDLTQPAVKQIALGDPQAVPAGIYAREYLEKLGIWSAIQPKVIPTESVRATLAAVESGNVDAGVVYGTDAHISKQVRIACQIPAEEAPRIRYPVALLKDAPQPEAGRRFLNYLNSPAADQVFKDFGFGLTP